MSLSTARAISDYLLTGMHHATSEEQVAMAQLIDAKVGQLDTVRTDLTTFFALLDLEEDSELTGKLFHPTRITSCRALDGQRINELLGRLKAFATSTP